MKDGKGLHHCGLCHTASGPHGPYTAIFVAVDGPPEPVMAATDGPPLPKVVLPVYFNPLNNF